MDFFASPVSRHQTAASMAASNDLFAKALVYWGHLLRVPIIRCPIGFIS
jgi:hypothetical protein